MRYTRAIGAIVIASLLAACGGGGGGGSAVPSAPTQPGPTSKAIGSVKITLSIPAARKPSARAAAYMQAQLAAHRAPKYLSGNTTELDFALLTENGSAASSADQQQYNFVIYASNSSECTGTSANGYQCTVTVPAPVGSDGYSVKAYQCSVAGSGPSNTCASLGGTLTALSSTVTTIHVALDATVVAAFTLSPVVSSIDWASVTYANVAGPSPMQSGLWLTHPNGQANPSYNATTSTYTCSASSGNGCYEPAGQGTSIAYGEMLEARDANGALIVGASGGSIYATPLYLDASGNPITISWSCSDPSLTLETGGGPFTHNSSATVANSAFNSPIANPASDADGGNTVDGNGNPVTAVGNNGIEISWDGVDATIPGSPFSCTATTSNGLNTNSANFNLGNGSGGITVQPGAVPDATVYVVGNPSGVAPLQDVLYKFAPGDYGTPAASVNLNSPGCPTGATNCESGGVFGAAFDPSGNLWFSGTDSSQGNIGEIDPNFTSNSQALNWLTGVNPASGTGPCSGVPCPNDKAMAFDAQGNMYVVDAGNASIDVYAPGATGTTAPTRVITSPNLFRPISIQIDSSGNLWVLQFAPVGQNIVVQGRHAQTTADPWSWEYPNLFEFAPGAGANATPILSALDNNWQNACDPPGAGPYAGYPASMAIDPQGNVVIAMAYFTNGSPLRSKSQIFVLPKGFNASTCPSNKFFVNPTPLQGSSNWNDIQNIAVDDVGYLYAITTGGGWSVQIYPEFASNAANGYATPYATYAWQDQNAYPAAMVVSTPSGFHSGDGRHHAAANKP